MSKLTRHTMFGLFLLVLPALAAAGEHDPLRNSLPPEKIEQIQAISQAVLTAKRNQPANPEMENLRQRVEDLHKAVVKLHERTLRAGKITALTLQNGQSVTPYSKLQQDEQKEKSLRADAEKGVRDALTRVRGQRAVVEQKVAESAVGEDHSTGRNAAAKVRELEDELDKILQSAPEERSASLQVMKERLAVKHFSLEEADKGKTPTITTIVRHRE